MHVAVIGAGIVGVTTAFELARDGHQVSVFERRGSVAEENSFAHAGLVAPGLPGPGVPLRLAWPVAPGQLGWLWRRWRAGRAPDGGSGTARRVRLAQYSQQRLRALDAELALAHEQARGCLMLLRQPRDLAAARARLKALAELGVDFHLVDADQARRIEPGLNPAAPLHAAVHLPSAEVGNARQFAHALRAQAQRLGAAFRFQRHVLGLTGGTAPTLQHRDAAGRDAPAAEAFDAVVVAAALGSAALLRPLGLRLPLMAVHGFSLTAPLRAIEGHLHLGPQAGVVDAARQVSITRLGQRVRVAGGAELGGRLDHLRPGAVQALHQALDDWFPGCARQAEAQRWKGAQPTLPDGLPLLGPSGTPGIWLNLGHGASGWALACGSARVLADQLAGRPPAIDVSGLDAVRLRR